MPSGNRKNMAELPLLAIFRGWKSCLRQRMNWCWMGFSALLGIRSDVFSERLGFLPLKWMVLGLESSYQWAEGLRLKFILVHIEPFLCNSQEKSTKKKHIFIVFTTSSHKDDQGWKVLVARSCPNLHCVYSCYNQLYWAAWVFSHVTR